MELSCARFRLAPSRASKIRLRGKGAPVLGNSSSRGDFYVVVRIEVPKNLDAESAGKLREYEACRNRAVQHRRAG